MEEKTFSIRIGGIDESIKNLESLESALASIEKKTDSINKKGGFSVASKEGNKAMDELAKLTQKIKQYDEEYARAVETSKGVLKDKNQAVKESLELEKAIITTENNVRDSYYDKQKVLSALGKQIKMMNTTTDEEKAKQQELIKEYNALNDELKSVDAQMGNHQRNVGNYSSALKDAKAQLKELKGEMVGLDKGSAEFNRLAKEAGALEDKIGDINQATKRYASDTKALDDVINIAKSATAAFQLWQGAMSAFGFETEEAEKAIQKLMGAMSIIQSLQTLSETLQASSASAGLLNTALKVTGVQLVTNQAAAIKATVAQEGLTTAQKAGAVASKTLGLALKAIPLMLIIGLVATLITNWEEIVGWFNKTFPVLNKLGGAMNALKAVVMGLGKAVIHWLVNPWKTFADVIKKVMAGDFKGAIQAAVDGAKKQFTGLGDAFNEGFKNQVTRGLEEISNKALEETNKQTKYQLDMLKAKAGADAAYSKQGIALQKKDFAERRKLAKNNKDELNKINVEEANFYRQCQEYKTKVAKEAADKRKKAEKEAAQAAKEAAAEAKRKAAEEEKKRKEAEKAAEEQRKKELEALKELNNARKTGANLEIDYQKAVLNEKKRVNSEILAADDEEIKSLNTKITQLQKLADNERLSKKTRMEATEQLEKAEAKLMKVEEHRRDILDEEAELEKDIVRLNKEKSEMSVFEELKDNLGLFKMTKDEFYQLIDGTSDKLSGMTETQVQYVKNAARQMKTIAQEAATSIEAITSGNSKKKGSSTSSGTSSGKGGKAKKKLWHGKDEINPATGKEYGFFDNLGELIQNLDEAVLAPAMDTFEMFMDFAIEETEQKLAEVEELHDKALDKVEESADKIAELNEKLKDSSTDNTEAIKSQLADEQLLYTQRLAEEKKLKDEETKLKNKAAEQEAKARKMELGYQMVMTIGNTAQGAAKALAEWGWPLGPVFAGLMTALGMTQVALLAAQISKIKPVKYADGGIINGKPHSQGGERVGNTNIEVEGGEMVVSKRNTEKYKDVLYKINRNDPSVRYLQSNKGSYADEKIRKYANGGTLNFESADANLRANNATNRLVSAIEDINMTPVVSVVDFWKEEDRLVRVRGLAGR